MTYSGCSSIFPSARPCWGFKVTALFVFLASVPISLLAQRDTSFLSTRLGHTPDAFVLGFGQFAVEAGANATLQRYSFEDRERPGRRRINDMLYPMGRAVARAGVLPRVEVGFQVLRTAFVREPFDKERRHTTLNIFDWNISGRLNASEGREQAPVVTLYFTYGKYKFMGESAFTPYKRYGATVSKLIHKRHLLSADFRFGGGDYFFNYKYAYRTQKGHTYFLEALGSAQLSPFNNNFLYGIGAQFKLFEWCYSDFGLVYDREKELSDIETTVNSYFRVRVGISLILNR